MTLRKRGDGNAPTVTHSAALPRHAFYSRQPPNIFDGTQTSVQPEKDELAMIMGRFDLFSRLPPSTINEIASVATVRVYYAGAFIWQLGARVTDIVLLESGFVKVARRDRSGASKTYGLY